MSKFSPNTLHLENSEEAAIVVTTAHHYCAASSGHEGCGAPDRRPSSQVSASQLGVANHWNVSRNVSYRVHCIVYRIVSWARRIVSALLVPGGGSPFVGLPRLLDRVSSRDSPVNSEDNQSRMGGAAGLPYAARDVVSAAGKPAYKSVRDGGSVSECNLVPASTQVSGSAPDVRQRRGCFVHQKGRRDQIVQTDPPDDSALEILRPEGYQASACSSSRITQHPGRRSVASGPDSCDGVGHQWPASSSSVLCMGNTSDRSVRNFCQQEAACLRITISGPEGQIRRCDVSTVVRDGNGVRLPTIQDAAGCPQKDPQVSQPVGDLNSSTPDVSIMDAGAIRAVSLSSNTIGRASTSYSRSSAAKRSRRDKTLPTLKSTPGYFEGSVCQARLQPARSRTHEHQSETILDWLLWIPLEQIRRVLSEKTPQCFWGR